MTQKNCQRCGKVMFKISTHSVAYWSTRKFCSFVCILKGGKQSKEHIAKRVQKNIGQKRSEETRERMSKVHTGEKSSQWIFDRSQVKDQDRHIGSAYNHWRKTCKERDGKKCKIRNKDCKGQLEIHHILGWKDHPELRYEVNNGITLCHFHHPTKREEERRLSPYFMELISTQNHD